MAAYQRGEVAAFEALLARHEQPLWNFLRRQTHDAATAEDLLQEIFTRVIKNAGRWTPDAKFSTWLYTIARNLCIDHARRQSHRRAVSLDGKGSHGAPSRDSDPERPLYDALAGREPGGEHRALNSELGAQLDCAITALPQAQREVFLMREILGMPFVEIAQAVGASEPTVKSRMRYALQALRAALTKVYDGGIEAEVKP